MAGQAADGCRDTGPDPSLDADLCRLKGDTARLAASERVAPRTRVPPLLWSGGVALTANIRNQDPREADPRICSCTTARPSCYDRVRKGGKDMPRRRPSLPGGPEHGPLVHARIRELMAEGMKVSRAVAQARAEAGKGLLSPGCCLVLGDEDDNERRNRKGV